MSFEIPSKKTLKQHRQKFIRTLLSFFVKSISRNFCEIEHYTSIREIVFLLPHSNAKIIQKHLAKIISAGALYGTNGLQINTKEKSQKVSYKFSAQ